MSVVQIHPLRFYGLVTQLAEVAVLETVYVKVRLLPRLLRYGVIGNLPVSYAGVLGSSPSTAIMGR